MLRTKSAAGLQKALQPWLHVCVGAAVGALLTIALTSRTGQPLAQLQGGIFTGGALPSDLVDHVGQHVSIGIDTPPARKAGYEYTASDYQALYDETWTKGGYPAQSCWGCRFGPDLVGAVDFSTVLDAGTGNGQMVRLLRRYGKSAWGIELSQAVLEQECPDLLSSGVVEHGLLTNLPYEDNSFDMVFSADVLEHIHEDEAEQVISELVRVSRHHLFLSISLKGHTKVTSDNDAEANRHTMLRPRTWWEERFIAHGVTVNRELLWAMQARDASYGPEDMSDCRTEGDRQAGGLYQVCVVNNTWLVGMAEQANVRRDRCVTTSNRELEPWFFAFRKP